MSANREVVEHARTQLGNLAHALKTTEDVEAEISDLNGGLSSLSQPSRSPSSSALQLRYGLKPPLSVIVNEASADPSSPLAGKVEEQAAVMRDQLSFYLNRARAVVRA